MDASDRLRMWPKGHGTQGLELVERGLSAVHGRGRWSQIAQDLG